MISKLGIPYMGSKRKLATRIVDKILLDNPDAKYIYDLFGGGGAISFEFLQRPQITKVVYNELNTGVVALLKDIKENGVTDKYFQWVDRETFMKHRGDDDWFGGLCKTVWSFGNNQRCYLFGKHIEENKRLGHLIVVDKSTVALKELSLRLDIELPESIFNSESMHDRRLAFYKVIRNSKKRLDLEQLERLEQIEQLELSNLSYRDVLIKTPINETIIYLDPPYINKAKYVEYLNHDEMYEWIKNCPYKVYISSYESHLKCVEEYEYRSILSNKTQKKVTERLFVNK